MARARTPVAKAKAAGADVKNPARHACRKSPKGPAELGPPSAHLSPFEMLAFDAFTHELPWLKESHRLLVEIASRYRGQLLDPAGHLSFQAAQELRRCLGQLGATPADESRVNTGDGGDDDEEDALFHGSGKAH